MINRTYLNWLVLINILTLACSFAFAGGGDAGGGVGVRCHGKLVTLERYEAQEMGIQLIENPLNLDDAKKVFHTVLTERINPQLTEADVDKIFKFLEVPAVLDKKHKIYMKKTDFVPLTNDWGKIRSNNGELRPNCKFEQIAKWDDNFDGQGGELITVDFPKLEELDFIDKFILFFHEHAYRLRREIGEKTSYFTRENIIDLLSVKSKKSSVDSKKSDVSCKIKLQVEDSSLLFDLSEDDEDTEDKDITRLHMLSEDIKSEIAKNSKYIISENASLVLKVKLSNNKFILLRDDPWSFKLTGTLGKTKYEGIGESYLTSEALELSIQNLIKALPLCK